MFNQYPTMLDALSKPVRKQLREAGKRVGESTVETCYRKLNEISREMSQGRGPFRDDDEEFRGALQGQISSRSRDELRWYQNKRPYYNLHPTIASSFMRLDIDRINVAKVLENLKGHFPCDNVTFGINVTGETAASQPLSHAEHGLRGDTRSILTSIYFPGEECPGIDREPHTHFISWNWAFEQKEEAEEISGDVKRILGDGADSFYETELLSHCCCSTCFHGGDEDASPFEVISSVAETETVRESVVVFGLKMAVGLALLVDDSLLIPDVLAKDRGKPRTEAVIRRAQNRGVRGYTVGEDLERTEVPAHYRNGCLQTYHVTEKTLLRKIESGEISGRASTFDKGAKGLIPIVQWRRGGVVNREEARKIPTGYIDTQKGQNNGLRVLCEDAACYSENVTD